MAFLVKSNDPEMIIPLNMLVVCMILLVFDLGGAG